MSGAWRSSTPIAARSSKMATILGSGAGLGSGVPATERYVSLSGKLRHSTKRLASETKPAMRPFEIAVLIFLASSGATSVGHLAGLLITLHTFVSNVTRGIIRSAIKRFSDLWRVI